MTWRFAHLTEQAKLAECYETPDWAIEAILDREDLTNVVVDPCCGPGRMAEHARQRGYDVQASDLYDWGYGSVGVDFLGLMALPEEATVFMNPPFSAAEAFVRHAIRLRARKIVCFQRFSWYESITRRALWEVHPPKRVYICESRANCWRVDIPPEERKSDTPTAHAWFVWSRFFSGETALRRLSKPEAAS